MPAFGIASKAAAAHVANVAWLARARLELKKAQAACKVSGDAVAKEVAMAQSALLATPKQPSSFRMKLVPVKQPVKPGPVKSKTTGVKGVQVPTKRRPGRPPVAPLGVCKQCRHLEERRAAGLPAKGGFKHTCGKIPYSRVRHCMYIYM